MRHILDKAIFIMRNYRTLYIAIAYLSGLLTIPAISLLFENPTGLLEGLIPEALGISFTVLLIDRLYSIREKETQEYAEKQRLMSELSLNTNVFAKKAASLLWRRGWLQDGSLSGENLEGASLEKAYLVDADFSGCDCRHANFSGAIMKRANLSLTYLRGVDFSGADLRDANLNGAKIFPDTIFDERTILPSGNTWTSQTDLTDFGCLFHQNHLKIDN